MTDRAEHLHLHFSHPVTINVHLPSAGSADQKLDAMLAQITTLFKLEKTDMATVAELKTRMEAQAAKLSTEVREMKDAQAAAGVALAGQNAVIATIRQQLADAIAAGGDITALNDVLATVDTQLEVNAATLDALKADIVANTAAASPA